MQAQLSRIREAYDVTVEEYRKGINWLEKVPRGFRESREFREFCEGAGSTNSGAPENKAFLKPRPGMNFLDAGCCANLANYRLDVWPSTYYGVDISPALIGAMRSFVTRKGISIGALEVAELAELPFEDGFFDIAAVIGVLEYVDLDYTASALAELNRVLKRRSRMVVDIPNLAHSHVETMFKLEEFLGRPNIPKSRTAFERILTPLFFIIGVDDSQVMLKYFVEAIK